MIKKKSLGPSKRCCFCDKMIISGRLVLEKNETKNIICIECLIEIAELE